MEPNKVMIINEATWALPGGSTDRLGPGLDKVWKVVIKADDLDTTFQGNIRIVNSGGTTHTYELPGSDATNDVNSHDSAEIWMLTGDYITRWTGLNHVEIYEYDGFNQQVLPVNDPNHSGIIVDNPNYATNSTEEIITLPVPYTGGSTVDPVNDLLSYPTEMYVAWVLQGYEWFLGELGSDGYLNFPNIANGYGIYFNTADAGNVTEIRLRGLSGSLSNSVGDSAVLSSFYNNGYCVDFNGNVMPPVSTGYSSLSCAGNGTWQTTGTNTYAVRYKAGLSSDLPEISTFDTNRNGGAYAIAGTLESQAKDESSRRKTKLKKLISKRGTVDSKRASRHLRGVKL